MNSQETYESDAAPKASTIQHSGPGFVRLKSKQKKLLRKALQGGLSREKALAVVQAVPIAKGLLPAPYGIQTSTPYPYSTFVKCVKIGVAPESAGTLLTAEEISRIKEAIVDVTVEKSGSQKPQFEGCVPRRGWLLITCSNLSTEEWFKQNFCHIQAKVDFKLKLMKESELPRKNVVRGYFPDSLSTSSKKVLEIIEAQNSVSTAEWRVMDRLIQGDFLHLVMAVDNESHKKLAKMGGTIFYRFGRLKLYSKSASDGKAGLHARKLTSNKSPSKESFEIPAPSQIAGQVQALRNNGSWNLCYNPWNTYHNAGNQWNQQPNFRYCPPYPREDQAPVWPGSGAWNG
ncbi:uncharacterized protein LOC108025366 [Drosophila biarmipes]|uniref:uncharacterized protein LOC108025366 n=1 Tax=Drosophila biarmipes TaxID=125945 RepID=UPI0007E7470E|nr:uncharacterized protein LOC108025366 [Drosophila biarmipes]XP_050744629.1 uncharacterized protein LOC108025366 [Drosophila biarmipes]